MGIVGIIALFTKVEYVDDNTVKVYGSLDFYQTYVFDMTILESLVERQHERLYQSNGLFLNTVDEGLDYGLEYVTTYQVSVYYCFKIIHKYEHQHYYYLDFQLRVIRVQIFILNQG